MQEIIRACQSGEVPMNFACVISSSPTAGGIEKARKLGIPNGDIVVIDPNNFRGTDGKVDQYGFGQKILETLKAKGVTIVSQNGWLPLTPNNVIDAYKESIYNQHPGPKRETRATYGIQPHAIMLYLTRHTGRNNGTEVIIHRVNSNWDDGATVGIAHVEIHLPHDYPKRLQERALLVEHGLQIEHLQRVAKGEEKEIESIYQYTRPGEENILKAARQYARKKYPKG
jgi:folate-dependent phosphoribosylglycinamide formyltransferase PurN